MISFTMKDIHEDFIVEEIGIPEIAGEGECFKYLLVKKNYNTFDAIAGISEFGEIAEDRIAYRGLKDEDGITSQEITVEEPISDKALNNISNSMSDESRYIRLSYLGRAKRLEVGKLIGNAFTVTLRNLDEDNIDAFSGLHHSDIAFLNYYDYQRFGIPGYPKVTHRIGECILQSNYAEAYKLYLKSGNTAADICDDPFEFFAFSVEPRKLSFFKNAYSSFLWNGKVEEILKQSGIETETETSTGITYTFSKKLMYLRNLNSDDLSVPYTKYTTKGTYQSDRPILTHTRVDFLDSGIDELHKDKYKVRIYFSLPSGSYATTLVRQLCASLSN